MGTNAGSCSLLSFILSHFTAELQRHFSLPVLAVVAGPDPWDEASILPLCCGLYYKNILMIVSDNHKLCLYYKCFISPSLSLS